MWHWTASDTTTTDDKNNKDSLTEVQYRRSSLVHNVHLHGCQMLTLRHGYLPQTELYTISTVSVISILWVPGTQTLGAEPHPKHDFKHETDSVHCVFWDKTVNVCLQSVSETAAITTWWQRCTVIQVNTAFCVTSYLELWHGITSPTKGGQHASTNVRLFLKHHRQATQHKYDISALVIRASKQCSDYRRVYNCCDVWRNWNKQSSLSVSSQVTTAAKFLLYCH